MRRSREEEKKERERKRRNGMLDDRCHVRCCILSSVPEMSARRQAPWNDEVLTSNIESEGRSLCMCVRVRACVCVCECVWICGCGELRNNEKQNNQQKSDENKIHDQRRARLIFCGY
jgi:hypothetical protein